MSEEKVKKTYSEREKIKLKKKIMKLCKEKDMSFPYFIENLEALSEYAKKIN